MFSRPCEISSSKNKHFDQIILDPPKFVDSKASLTKACRGYKDINMLAMQILRPGGILCTFSCSGLLSFELFQKVVADAALDAGKNGANYRKIRPSDRSPCRNKLSRRLLLKRTRLSSPLNKKSFADRLFKTIKQKKLS